MAGLFVLSAGLVVVHDSPSQTREGGLRALLTGVSSLGADAPAAPARSSRLARPVALSDLAVPLPSIAPTTVVPATAAPATTAPAPLVTLPTLPPLPLPLPVLPAPVPAPAPAPSAPDDGLAPYRGLATWVDVYDWSVTFGSGRGGPTVTPADVDRMAAAGVQALFIQASKHDAPTDVLEADLLHAFIDRARDKNIKIVAWYLPTLVDVGRDLQRMKAIAKVPGFDGLAVDIEARNVADVAERSRRLVELSRALRQALPGATLGAIVMPPVQIEVVNPAYWPNFPYREIASSYDAWMTMGYWTFRTQASGYRNAYAYTKENVIRLRKNLGQPNAPVHPVGGIGAGTTAADIEGFRKAITDTGGFGGSIYDWQTTAASLWDNLRPMRVR